MQDGIESNLDQIEVRIGKHNKYGKKWNSSFRGWNLFVIILTSYHVISHLMSTIVKITNGRAMAAISIVLVDDYNTILVMTDMQDGWQHNEAEDWPKT